MDSVIAIEVTKANFPIRPQINECSLEECSETDELNKASPRGFGVESSAVKRQAEVERLEKLEREIMEQRRNLAQMLKETKDEINEKYEREKIIPFEREKVHSFLSPDKEAIITHEEEKELLREKLRNLDNSLSSSRDYFDTASQGHEYSLNGDIGNLSIVSMSIPKPIQKEISFNDLLTTENLVGENKKKENA